MGLDMYLSAKRYLSSYREDEKAISDQIASLDALECGGLRPKYITTEAMYWRKANAIHRWFVENCQDGEDDCNEYYVSHEQLQKLLDACKTILADHEKASDILPTQSGFFFGSTEFDEWFWDDIKHTAQSLEKLLANVDPKKWSFYYQSSW